MFDNVKIPEDLVSNNIPDAIRKELPEDKLYLVDILKIIYGDKLYVLVNHCPAKEFNCKNDCNNCANIDYRVKKILLDKDNPDLIYLIGRQLFTSLEDAESCAFIIR